MKIKLLVLLLTISLVPNLKAFGQSDTWTIDANHSQADFEVRHMGINNIRGALSNISGTVIWNAKDISKSRVAVTIDTTTLNTTSAYRDKHLKTADFFDIEKYPTLTFKSTSVNLAGNVLKVTGDLTITGVTKSVTLDVNGPTAPTKNDQGVLVSGLSATTIINRNDFNFGTKFPASLISNEVKITIDAELDQK
jgi:polyisoprenoid-binding protein YceI